MLIKLLLVNFLIFCLSGVGFLLVTSADTTAKTKRVTFAIWLISLFVLIAIVIIGIKR